MVKTGRRPYVDPRRRRTHKWAAYLDDVENAALKALIASKAYSGKAEAARAGLALLVEKHPDLFRTP